MDWISPGGVESEDAVAASAGMTGAEAGEICVLACAMPEVEARREIVEDADEVAISSCPSLEDDEDKIVVVPARAEASVSMGREITGTKKCCEWEDASGMYVCM